MSSVRSQKIMRVEYVPFSLPYKRPMRMASFTFERGDFVLVRLHLEGGVTGIGEIQCPPILGTTIEGALGVLDTYILPILIGKDVFEIDRIVAEMDRVIEANSVVKAGVDAAVYDAQGKCLSLPVCKLLGACYREEIDVEWAVGVDVPERMADQVEKAFADGYRAIELKGSGDPERDLEVVRLSRERVGPVAQLKMDFNEGYSVAVAIKTLRKMEQFNLVMYEQPVPGWDLDGLAAVTAAVDTPVMADEALSSETDLLRIAQKRAADIVHVKPPRVGGLFKSRRILAMAQCAGLACTIGPYMASGIGIAAAHQLVASCRKLFRTDHYGVSPTNADDILREPIQETKATVKFRMGPGLGVELDESKLERYRVQR